MDDSFLDLLDGAGGCLEPPAEPAACPGCQQARQEVSDLRCRLRAMDLIKEKIIKTDQLIGRYSQLSARHREQTRRLEESSQLVAQLNRDCGRHESELSQQLLQLTELRQELETKTELLKTMTAELSESQTQRQGVEAAMSQYKTALQELEKKSESDLQAAREKVIATEESRRANLRRTLEVEFRRRTLVILQDAVLLGNMAASNATLTGKERKAFTRCKKRLINVQGKLSKGAKAAEKDSNTKNTKPAVGDASAAAGNALDLEDNGSGSDSDDSEFGLVTQAPAATQRLFASPPSSPLPSAAAPSTSTSPLPFTFPPSPPSAKSAEDTSGAGATTATAAAKSKALEMQEATRTAGMPLHERSAAVPAVTAVAAGASVGVAAAAAAKAVEVRPGRLQAASRPVSPLLADLCDLPLLSSLDTPLNVSISMPLNVPQSGLGLADILEGRRQTQTQLRPQLLAPPAVKRTLARVTAVPLPGTESGGGSTGAEDTEEAKGNQSQGSSVLASNDPPSPSCEDTGENVDGNGDDDATEGNELPELDSVVLEKLEGMPVLVTLDPEGGGPLDVSIVPSTDEVSNLGSSSGDIEDTSNGDVSGATGEDIDNSTGAPALPMPALGMDGNDGGCSVGRPMPALDLAVDNTTLHADLSMSDADDDTSGGSEKLNPSPSPPGGRTIKSSTPRRHITRIVPKVTGKRGKSDFSPSNADMTVSASMSCETSGPAGKRSASVATNTRVGDTADDTEASNRETDKDCSERSSRETKINNKNVSEKPHEDHVVEDIAGEDVAVVPGGWGAIGSRLSDDSEPEESPGPAVSMPLFGSPALVRSRERCESPPNQLDTVTTLKERSAGTKKSARSLFDSPKGKEGGRENSMASMFDSPVKGESAILEEKTTHASTGSEKSVKSRVSKEKPCSEVSMFETPDKTMPSISSTISSMSGAGSPPDGVGSILDSPEKQNMPVLLTSASTPAKSSPAPQASQEAQPEAGTTQLPLDKLPGENDALLKAPEIQVENRPQPDTGPNPAFQAPAPVSNDPTSERRHHRHRRRKRRKERRTPEWERRLSQPAEEQNVLDLLRNMTQLGDVLAPLPGAETMVVAMPLSPMSERTEEAADEVPETRRTEELCQGVNDTKQTELPGDEQVQMPFEKISKAGRMEKRGKTSFEEDADTQSISADHTESELAPEEIIATAEMKGLIASPSSRRPLLHLDSSGFEVSENACAGEKPPPVAVLSPLAVTASAAAAAAGVTVPALLRVESEGEPCTGAKEGSQDVVEGAIESVHSGESAQEVAVGATKAPESEESAQEVARTGVEGLRPTEASQDAIEVGVEDVVSGELSHKEVIKKVAETAESSEISEEITEVAMGRAEKDTLELESNSVSVEAPGVIDLKSDNGVMFFKAADCEKLKDASIGEEKGKANGAHQTLVKVPLVGVDKETERETTVGLLSGSDPHMPGSGTSAAAEQEGQETSTEYPPNKGEHETEKTTRPIEVAELGSPIVGELTKAANVDENKEVNNPHSVAETDEVPLAAESTKARQNSVQSTPASRQHETSGSPLVAENSATEQVHQLDKKSSGMSIAEEKRTAKKARVSSGKKTARQSKPAASSHAPVSACGARKKTKPRMRAGRRRGSDARSASDSLPEEIVLDVELTFAPASSASTAAPVAAGMPTGIEGARTAMESVATDIASRFTSVIASHRVEGGQGTVSGSPSAAPVMSVRSVMATGLAAASGASLTAVTERAPPTTSNVPLSAPCPLTQPLSTPPPPQTWSLPAGETLLPSRPELHQPVVIPATSCSPMMIVTGAALPVLAVSRSAAPAAVAPEKVPLAGATAMEKTAPARRVEVPMNATPLQTAGTSQPTATAEVVTSLPTTTETAAMAMEGGFVEEDPEESFEVCDVPVSMELPSENRTVVDTAPESATTTSTTTTAPASSTPLSTIVTGSTMTTVAADVSSFKPITTAACTTISPTRSTRLSRTKAKTSTLGSSSSGSTAPAAAPTSCPVPITTLSPSKSPALAISSALAIAPVTIPSSVPVSTATAPAPSFVSAPANPASVPPVAPSPDAPIPVVQSAPAPANPTIVPAPANPAPVPPVAPSPDAPIPVVQSAPATTSTSARASAPSTGCRFDWSRRLRKLKTPSQATRRRWRLRLLRRGPLWRAARLHGSLSLLAGVSAVNFADREPRERLLTSEWWQRRDAVVERDWKRLAGQGVVTTQGRDVASLATVASRLGSLDVTRMSLGRCSDQATSGEDGIVALGGLSTGNLPGQAPTGLHKAAAAESSVGSYQTVELARQNIVATEQDAGRRSGAGQCDRTSSSEVANPLPLRQSVTQRSHTSDLKDTVGVADAEDKDDRGTQAAVLSPNQQRPPDHGSAISDTAFSPLEVSENSSNKNESRHVNPSTTSQTNGLVASSAAASQQVSLSVSQTQSRLPIQTLTQTQDPKADDYNSDASVIRDVTAVAAESHVSSESSDSEWNPLGRRRITRGRVSRRLSSDSTDDEEGGKENESSGRDGARKSPRRAAKRFAKARSQGTAKIRENILTESQAVAAVDKIVDSAVKTITTTRRSRSETKEETPEMAPGEFVEALQPKQMVDAAQVEAIEIRSESSRPVQFRPDSPVAFAGFLQASLGSHSASTSLKRFSLRAAPLLAPMEVNSRELVDGDTKRTPTTVPRQGGAEVGAMANVVPGSGPGTREKTWTGRQQQTIAESSKKSPPQTQATISKKVTAKMCQNAASEVDVETTEDEITEVTSTPAMCLRRMRQRSDAAVSPSPRRERTSRRRMRSDETTEDESQQSPLTRLRNSTMSGAEEVEEESRTPARRRRMPARQAGVEEDAVMQTRRTRGGLRRDQRMSECETESETCLQGDIATPSSRQRRSPRGRKNSECAVSDGEIEIKPLRQLRSRSTGSGSVAKESQGQRPSQRDVDVTLLSRSPCTETASALETTRDQLQKTPTPSERVTSVTPPLPSASGSSVVGRLKSPTRTQLSRLPPVILPPQFTGGVAASSTSTPPTPTHLAVRPVGALLRPARVLRARPTARQVSIPGSRFSGETTDTVVSPVVVTPKGAQRRDEKSQMKMSKSDDCTLSRVTEDVLEGDVAAKGTELVGEDGAVESPRMEDGEAGAALEDGDCGNADWAAEVSSDSDASESPERPLVIKDNSVDGERGTSKNDAKSDMGKDAEDFPEDSESELVIDDAAVDNRGGAQSEIGQSGKGEDVVPPTEDCKSGSPDLSKSVLVTEGGESNEPEEARKPTTCQASIASQIKAKTTSTTKAGRRKLRDLRTKNGNAQKTSCAAPAPDPVVPDPVTKNVKRASSEINKKERKKLKRPLSDQEDNAGDDEDAVPASDDVKDRHDAILDVPEPSTSSASSFRPVKPVKPVVSFIQQPQKKPVGQGSRLLAKLRRANSMPAAASSLSSSRFGSSSGLGSSRSDTSRPIRSHVPLKEEAKSIYRRGCQPPGDLQALGDWTTRPRESRVRSCGDQEQDRGSVGDNVSGSLPKAGAKVRRAPVVRSLPDTPKTKPVLVENSASERRTSSTMAKSARSGEKSNASAVKFASSGERPSGSAVKNETETVNQTEGMTDFRGSSLRTQNGTISCAARKPPAPLIPSVLEEVDDHRPPVKKPRMAHQAAVARTATARQPTPARRKTVQRPNVKEEESVQLPSFYQLLQPAPTSSHPSTLVPTTPTASPSQPTPRAMTPSTHMTPSTTPPQEMKVPPQLMSTPATTPSTTKPPPLMATPAMPPSTAMPPPLMATPAMPPPMQMQAFSAAAAAKIELGSVVEAGPVVSPQMSNVYQPPFNKECGQMPDNVLAELVSRLLNTQPGTTDWNQLMRQLAASRVTDEAIVSHLCHRVAVTPPPPLNQPSEATPPVDVQRPCACAVQLGRHGRHRLRELLQLRCRQQLLHRRPALPLPCRLQLLRLFTALCRLGGAAGECRALLLDLALLRPAELIPAVLAVIHTWRKALCRRNGVPVSPVEKVVLHHVLANPPTDQQETLNVLQPMLKSNYRQASSDEASLGHGGAEKASVRLVKTLAECRSRDEAVQTRSALLLLCALHGADWTNDHPLERGVVPLLASWRAGNAGKAARSRGKGGGEPVSDAAAAAAVTITGELAALYHRPTDQVLEESVCILEGLVLHRRPSATSEVTAAARAALLLLLRRHLPAESERRLRHCLDSLPPPADDNSAISGTGGEAGDGNAISGAVGEADDGAAVSAAKGKTSAAGGDYSATSGATEETRPVTRWFGASDEYF